MAKVKELAEIDADLRRLELGMKRLEKEIKETKAQLVKLGKDIKETLALMKFLTELADSDE